jgi:hypothetical protein
LAQNGIYRFGKPQGESHMPKLIRKTPAYRLHKPSGQAVVTLDGRDCYLGKHETDTSTAEYDRLVGVWLSNGRRHASPGKFPELSINELLTAPIRAMAELQVGTIAVQEGLVTWPGRTGQTTVITTIPAGLGRVYGRFTSETALRPHWLIWRLPRTMTRAWPSEPYCDRNVRAWNPWIAFCARSTPVALWRSFSDEDNCPAADRGQNQPLSGN